MSVPTSTPSFLFSICPQSGAGDLGVCVLGEAGQDRSQLWGQVTSSPHPAH